MNKYIHYCWFGGKPLPKLAKKCIKSWKKYLPDYEIIEWNEKNFNVEECEFSKEAYDEKKWAFVADYARTKVLHDMGGIYFDTDMLVTKDFSKLLNDKTFLGVEDSGKIAVGVWYESESNSYLTTKLLEFYNQCNGFDTLNTYVYSIPNIITKLIDDDSFILGKNKVQHLNHDITIYPREYFYPLSYDRQNNIFTENTCMIHYYDSSWVPKYQQRENKIFRLLGNDKGQKFINICRRFKRLLKGILKIFLFPFVIRKNKIKKMNEYEELLKTFDNQLSNIKGNSYLAIYRKDWLGTSFATKELFENCVGIGELTDEKVVDYYVNSLVKRKFKLIIFSAFDLSWINLIKQIKDLNPNQKIKVLWHGSNAMNIERYDWEVFRTVLEYCKYGLIDSIGFVKKSMYEFYKAKGIKSEFVMNTLTIDKNKYKTNITKDKYVRIGLYASGDRWVKNFYNQLSAASMIKNHLIECIPRSEKVTDFASIINCNVIGENKPVQREELLRKIAKNDINIYVTFVECAPLLPLESLELGVPCITSNNHHYWEGTELEKYLVVDAPDNIIEIKKKIEYALENKEKIIKLYNKWKIEYDKKAIDSVEKFINI